MENEVKICNSTIPHAFSYHSYINCSVYVGRMERERKREREKRICCLFICRKTAVISIGSGVTGCYFRQVI